MLREIQERLDSLMEINEGPVLSIYQPTHRRGEGVAQDPIRFKNLVSDATELIEEQVDERDVRKKMVEKLGALQDDAEFWRAHRAEGLALFMRGDEYVTFDLAHAVPERASLDEIPYLIPLMEAYQHAEPHLVLELHKDAFSLYTSDGHSFSPCKRDDLPKWFAELFDDFDAESNLNHGSYGGGGGAMYHGHRSSSEEKEKDKEKYYVYLDRELTPILKEMDRPIVMAGVTENIADWRQVADDPIYAKKDVDRPVSQLSEEEYAEEADRIFQGLEADMIVEKLDLLDQRMANSKASLDRSAVEYALKEGRVEALLIKDGYPSDDSVELNRLAHDTMNTGGSVVIVPADEDRMSTQVAAIYRY